jgi:hypothetical protein
MLPPQIELGCHHGPQEPAQIGRATAAEGRFETCLGLAPFPDRGSKPFGAGLGQAQLLAPPVRAAGRHLDKAIALQRELKPAGGIIGVGFDELRWPRPVRPGDELRVESEVLEVRPSRSRPEDGLIKVRATTLNQQGEAVQIFVANLLVPRRPVSSNC